MLLDSRPLSIPRIDWSDPAEGGVLLGAVLIAVLALAPGWGYAQDTETQQISLQQGENWVSLRVQPADASLNSIFQGHLDQILRVRDEDGRVYMPAQDIEQFTTWEPGEGYKVYAEDAVDVEVSGSPVPTATSIPLQQGGNLVPYLPPGTQSAEVALASISEALVRVEGAEGDIYDPGGSSATLDSMRAGRGYAVYVDQPDTLRYPIQTKTLTGALALEGVEVGQRIHVRGRDESGDGGGGIFKVTDSGAEADGGTVFMFDEDLTQVTGEQVGNIAGGAVPLANSDIEFRGFTVRYGPDPEDEMGLRHFIAQSHDKDKRLQLTADLAAGAVGQNGIFDFNKLHGLTSWDKDKNEVDYQYATSSRRLERQNVGQSVKPEWWGAVEGDSTVNNSPELQLALLKANEIYENSGYDWTYVDLDGTYYYREAPRTPGGVQFRGVGPLDHDSSMPTKYQDDYTRATLRLMPGEALYYRKKSILNVNNNYSPSKDNNRSRSHHWAMGPTTASFGNAYEAEKVGYKKVKIDGNVRNNMQYFNNLSDYLDAEQWLQDSGDWCGFYTRSKQNWKYSQAWLPVHLEDFHVVDVGGSGIAIGNTPDHNPDVQTAGKVEVYDTRRNHPAYGLSSQTSIDGLTLQGQYWGGIPLFGSNPLTPSQAPSYTNVTVKNIEEGQFGFNTIIASRGAGMEIDGFTIDLRDGPQANAIAVQDQGNKFKNGTIHASTSPLVQRGYPPEGEPTRGSDLNDAFTLLKNVTQTTYDSSNAGKLVDRNLNEARLENVTYKVDSGTPNNVLDVGGSPISFRVPTEKNWHPKRAIRLELKDVEYLQEFEESMAFGFDTDVVSELIPKNVFWNGGKMNNNPQWKNLLGTPPGFPRDEQTDPKGRTMRVFLNDVTFRNKTEGAGNFDAWHNQFDTSTPVGVEGTLRMRNAQDFAGRVSDNSGTYTSDGGDEGNDFVLISTNLLSTARERSATVTSGSRTVQSTESVNGPINPDLRVNLDAPIQAGNTIDVGWEARVTPLDAYSTTGLFIARKITNKSYTSGNGPWTLDLRGTAATQESRDPIVYTASSDDTSVVTANVQDDDYTLELTEQGTGTATITVTGEILGVGTTTESFDVTVNQ